MHSLSSIATGSRRRPVSPRESTAADPPEATLRTTSTAVRSVLPAAAPRVMDFLSGLPVCGCLIRQGTVGHREVQRVHPIRVNHAKLIRWTFAIVTFFHVVKEIVLAVAYGRRYNILFLQRYMDIDLSGTNTYSLLSAIHGRSGSNVLSLLKHDELEEAESAAVSAREANSTASLSMSDTRNSSQLWVPDDVVEKQERQLLESLRRLARRHLALHQLHSRHEESDILSPSRCSYRWSTPSADDMPLHTIIVTGAFRHEYAELSLLIEDILPYLESSDKCVQLILYDLEVDDMRTGEHSASLGSGIHPPSTSEKEARLTDTNPDEPRVLRDFLPLNVLELMCVQVRTFNYSNFPPHIGYTNARRTSAWRAASLFEVLVEVEESKLARAAAGQSTPRRGDAFLIWMDPIVALGPEGLLGIMEGLQAEGFVATSPCASEVTAHCEQRKEDAARATTQHIHNSTGSGDDLGAATQTHICSLREMTADETMRIMGVGADDGILSTRLMNREMIGASVVGFDLRDRKVTTRLLIPWINCCLTQACVAPLGANQLSHGFDESALSIAAYSYGMGRKFSFFDLGVICRSVKTQEDVEESSVDRLKDAFREYQRAGPGRNVTLHCATGSKSQYNGRQGMIRVSYQDPDAVGDWVRVILYDEFNQEVWWKRSIEWRPWSLDPQLKPSPRGFRCRYRALHRCGAQFVPELILSGRSRLTAILPNRWRQKGRCPKQKSQHPRLGQKFAATVGSTRGCVALCVSSANARVGLQLVTQWLAVAVGC
eukprot:scaffold940_cov569-Prasinococcus_capsulatus_cf.AAC.3